MKIEQVEPYETWPSGDSRPLAVLNVTTAELEQQNGLRFAGELDDELGDYLFAAVEPTPGHQFWLLKYTDDPNDGIQVYADSSESPDSLRELLDGLELSADSVEWSAQSSPRAPSWSNVFGELEAQGWLVEDRGAFIHVELASGRFRVRIADDLDEESLLSLPKSLRQLGNLAELRVEPA